MRYGRRAFLSCAPVASTSLTYYLYGLGYQGQGELGFGSANYQNLTPIQKMPTIVMFNNGSNSTAGFLPGDIVYQGSSLATATCIATFVTSYNQGEMPGEFVVTYGAFNTSGGSTSGLITSTNNHPITSIVASSGWATVTLPTAVWFGQQGTQVTISGVTSPSALNGTYIINNVNGTTFQYPTSAVGTANGTITFTVSYYYGSNAILPTILPSFGFTQISLKYQTAIALKNDGTVWTCGNNSNAQLGTGAVSGGSYSWLQLGTATNIVAVDSGDEFSAILDSSGNIWTIGNNSISAQCHNGNSTVNALSLYNTSTTVTTVHPALISVSSTFIAVTFSAVLSGATSGTLAATWTGLTGSYELTFSNNVTQTVTLTNGATSVSWTTAVTATANAQAVQVLTFTSSLASAMSGMLSTSWTGLTGQYNITFSNGTTQTALLVNGSTAVAWPTAVTATTAISVNGVFNVAAGQPSSITFTSALSAATSASLSSSWSGVTGLFTVTFSDGSVQTASLTNGSASISWPIAVTATASATIYQPITGQGEFVYQPTGAQPNPNVAAFTGWIARVLRHDTINNILTVSAVSGTLATGPIIGYSTGIVATVLNATTTPPVFKKLAVGHRWVAAIDSYGHLWTWGNNSVGQSGRPALQNGQAWLTPTATFCYFNNTYPATVVGNGTSATAPDLVSNVTQDLCCRLVNLPLSNVGGGVPLQVSAVFPGSANGVCICTDNNGNTQLYGWGSNTATQLGVNQSGSTTTIPHIIPCASGSWYAGSSSGNSNNPVGSVILIRSDFTMWAAGTNTNGQLGIGSTTTPSDFTQIQNPIVGSTAGTWKQVSCGFSCTLAIDNNGNLWGWGSNAQIGAATLTFSSTLTAAIAGTLTAAWSNPTGQYCVTFATSSGNTGVLASLTNGSTAVTWTGAITTTSVTATVAYAGSTLNNVSIIGNSLSPVLLDNTHIYTQITCGQEASIALALS